jgi:potassium efflux system protein
LLAWIPVLRLLPPQVVKLVGPRMYISSACYLLNVAASLLAGHEFWYRSLLLVIDFLALASFAWLSERSRRSALVISGARNVAALKFLLVVAAAVLLASIGSNVLGNVSLATMLTGAVLDSNYIAIALYALATVFVALFRMLLPGPLASSSTLGHAGSLVQAGARVGRTLLIGAWLVYVLQAFRAYRPLLDFVVAVFSYHFKLGVLSISLGSCAGFVAAAWVSYWLANSTMRSSERLPVCLSLLALAGCATQTSRRAGCCSMVQIDGDWLAKSTLTAIMFFFTLGESGGNRNLSLVTIPAQ